MQIVYTIVLLLYGGGGSVSHSLFLESNFPNHIIRIGSESNSPNNISPNQSLQIKFLESDQNIVSPNNIFQKHFPNRISPISFSKSKILGNVFFEGKWIYERKNHERTTRRADSIYYCNIYMNNRSQQHFSKIFLSINLPKAFLPNQSLKKFFLPNRISPTLKKLSPNQILEKLFLESDKNEAAPSKGKTVSAASRVHTISGRYPVFTLQLRPFHFVQSALADWTLKKLESIQFKVLPTEVSVGSVPR